MIFGWLVVDLKVKFVRLYTKAIYLLRNEDGLISFFLSVSDNGAGVEWTWMSFHDVTVTGIYVTLCLGTVRKNIAIRKGKIGTKNMIYIHFTRQPLNLIFDVV